MTTEIERPSTQSYEGQANELVPSEYRIEASHCDREVTQLLAVARAIVICDQPSYKFAACELAHCKHTQKMAFDYLDLSLKAAAHKVAVRVRDDAVKLYEQPAHVIGDKMRQYEVEQLVERLRREGLEKASNNRKEEERRLALAESVLELLRPVTPPPIVLEEKK